jgi:hypothetical protein
MSLELSSALEIKDGKVIISNDEALKYIQKKQIVYTPREQSYIEIWINSFMIISTKSWIPNTK